MLEKMSNENKNERYVKNAPAFFVHIYEMEEVLKKWNVCSFKPTVLSNDLAISIAVFFF